MNKNKKLFVMFSIFLILMLFSNIFGVTNFKPKYGITKTNVNFRSNPNKVIYTIKKNNRIKLVGTLDNYYIVQSEKNYVGLINKSFVNISNKKSNTLSYTSILKYSALTKSNTNVRRGPGSHYTKIDNLKKNTKVTVIGKIKDFSLVIYNTNKIGMIKSTLLTKETNNTTNNITNNISTNTNNNNLLINYINNYRKENNLKPYIKDNRLMNISNLKANDISKNNYFLHKSKTYGTPFEMMQSYKIKYITAGENIATNTSVKKIFDSWKDSTIHKKNLLSLNYNYIGVSVIPNKKYGYVAVAMFIQK